MSEAGDEKRGWWKRRSKKGKFFIIVVGFIALVSIGSSLSSGNKDSTTGTPVADNSNNTVQQTTEQTPTKEQSNEASSDNTPHMDANGSVVVDTLRWEILEASRARTLGNQFSHQAADGIYVVAKMRVHNGKSESVTINSDQVTLEVNGNEYKYDSDGTIAFQLGGDEKTFFLKDLGPDVTTTGTVVFDVPPSVLSNNPELCFHELGFGSSKGCIKLPSV